MRTTAVSLYLFDTKNEKDMELYKIFGKALEEKENSRVKRMEQGQFVGYSTFVNEVFEDPTDDDILAMVGKLGEVDD